MLTKLLVANRGEIALRIARTARRMGLRTIGVYSDADGRDAPHLRGFDDCIGIGGRGAPESYLRIDALLDAARRGGADAVHPGYGFLSENADFARAVVDAGLTWIGPPPSAMRAMADKGAARRRVAAMGVPVLPGFDGAYASLDELHAHAASLGLPLMIKAASGGGGRGMRRVDATEALRPALEAAAREAEAAFGGEPRAAYGREPRAAYGGVRLIAERALDDPRHVEVQVFADAHGNVIHLGERDCSVQRRHQKIVEEAPCAVLDATTRRRIGDVAVRIAREIGYVGAGTVEFLFQPDGEFWFLEMNTRLQVEHPVTEALLGIDLVEWQLRIADGEALPLAQDEALARFEAGGHAIEARLCAEDPANDFMPRTGTLRRWRAPPGVRCDHALADGLVIGPDYDSMLAKIVAHASTRTAAILQLGDALDRTLAHGVATNRGYLARLVRSDAFRAGGFGTGFVAAYRDEAAAPSWLEALAAATLALIGTRSLPPSWLGWTSSGWFECELPLRIGGGQQARRWHISGSPGAWQATNGERHHVVTALDHSDPGTLRVRIDGRDVTASLTRHGTRLWLQCDGHEIAVDDDRFAGASAARDIAADALHAPMHGKLLQLPEPGAAVRAGDVLAVIEAMKIEHALAAPATGTVRAVHARVGEQVAARALLVEIDVVAQPSGCEK